MMVIRILKGSFVLGAVLSVFAVVGHGQDQTVATSDLKVGLAQDAGTKASAPLLSDLRGVKLGMTVDEVKEKLGRAEIDDKDGLYYVFSDAESMQLRIDADKKVSIAATTYSGNRAKAPALVDVFGGGAVSAPAADGRIYKMVRYPASGYWVSYSRIVVGSGPITTITMQRIR